VSDNPLAHVLWIGGPPCCGKTSIARALAGRHGLRAYHADARTWEHHDKALERGFPAAARWESMTPDEQWLADVDDMVELSLAANEERCLLMIEDVETLPCAPLTVVEGTPLLPWLLADRLASRDHAVWLVPSPGFQRARLEERPRVTFERTSEPARALENRIRRELRVGEEIERDARARGFDVLRVDGSCRLEEMTAAVESIFARVLRAGPRAETEHDRWALRRESNVVLLRQVSTYFERVPEAGDPETTPVPFACECGRGGCDATAELPLARVARIVREGGAVVADGHAAVG
jgi:hypothetical protein